MDWEEIFATTYLEYIKKNSKKSTVKILIRKWAKKMHRHFTEDTQMTRSM